MRKSKNYEMSLFDEDDFYNEEQLNENTEKLDEALKSLENPEYDISKQTEVEKLSSRESLKVALRKLAKAVADYISHKADKVAHITEEDRTTWNEKVGTEKIATNLTTDTEGMVLAAAMGKKLQNNKVDKVSGRGLSTNDYTTAEKTKLAGIATGANKTTVDSVLSSSSTNPVQNKVVTEQINQVLGFIATQLGSILEWKNATSCYINSAELGACYYICMPETDTMSNVGKEVLVVYNNGAIAKGKIVKSASNYGLENPVTFLTDTTLPLVDKTTIQGGTNTLPHSNNGTIGYCMEPGYGYGAVFEISKSNTYATKYLIF